MCIVNAFDGQMKVLFHTNNDVFIVEWGRRGLVPWAVSFASLDSDIWSLLLAEVSLTGL